MGFIRMSPDFIPNMVNYFTMLGQSTTSTAAPITSRGMLVSHAMSSGEVGARLAIFKGTVPVDFSTLTSFNAKASDLLITYDATAGTSSTGINQFTGSQGSVNPMVITTTYVNATATGTATWFWWFTTPMSGGSVWNNTVVPYNQIVGTVGTTGSGADLTIPSVAITTGSPYRIFNYRLQIPTEWTF
jgi:hypothetical protein